MVLLLLYGSAYLSGEFQKKIFNGDNLSHPLPCALELRGQAKLETAPQRCSTPALGINPGRFGRVCPDWGKKDVQSQPAPCRCSDLGDLLALIANFAQRSGMDSGCDRVETESWLRSVATEVSAGNRLSRGDLRFVCRIQLGPAGSALASLAVPLWFSR
jgi:hypothetical protein